MRALVTGGASPLGEAIARRLAEDGHRVILHVHANAERGRLLAEELDGEFLTCDLTDIPAVEAALRPVLDRGVPQILVHNAGVHDDVPFAGMSERQWREVIGVTLDGFYAVARSLLLPMIATRHGRVVALSSVSARRGTRGQANYAAAKAGLEGAVRSLSREVACRGITVNAVAPGIIATPATEAMFDKRTIANLVPMKRAGLVTEVADLVGFLVSARAAYITGQTITIDGGMM